MAKQRDQELVIHDDGGGDDGRKIVDDDATKVCVEPGRRDGFGVEPQPLAVRRIRFQRKLPNRVEDGIGTASDYEESLEFGRDTNRLDYFRVTPFNVFGDDDIAIDGGGGGGGGGNRTPQGSLGISLNNYNDNMSDSSIRDDAGGADGSNISRQIPVEVFADNGSGDVQVLVQRLDQQSSIGGVEGAGFWVRRWWEKWWLFLDLWKTS